MWHTHKRVLCRFRFSVCSMYYQHFVRLQPLLEFTGEYLTATTLQNHILMLIKWVMLTFLKAGSINNILVSFFVVILSTFQTNVDIKLERPFVNYLLIPSLKPWINLNVRRWGQTWLGLPLLISGEYRRGRRTMFRIRPFSINRNFLIIWNRMLYFRNFVIFRLSEPIPFGSFTSSCAVKFSSTKASSGPIPLSLCLTFHFDSNIDSVCLPYKYMYRFYMMQGYLPARFNMKCHLCINFH